MPATVSHHPPGRCRRHWLSSHPSPRGRRGIVGSCAQCGQEPLSATPLDLPCSRGERDPLTLVGITEYQSCPESQTPCSALRLLTGTLRPTAGRGLVEVTYTVTELGLTPCSLLSRLSALLPQLCCTPFLPQIVQNIARQPQRTKCDVSSCITNEGHRL